MKVYLRVPDEGLKFKAVIIWGHFLVDHRPDQIDPWSITMWG
jgi:hypothetical protein